jgi:phosphoglycerol transferase MdoB-like AlkP superfamily enzyme
MKTLKKGFSIVLKMFLFWILVFDFQRILFSIHNWDKFTDVSFFDWCLSFIYSIRLDLSTAAYLSSLPLVFLIIRFLKPNKLTKYMFFGVLFFELLIVSLIHAGEVNAYPEWNHKLTSRVFMHLSNPDEVFRTADYTMTIGFVIYTVLELVFGWRILRWLFFKDELLDGSKWYVRAPKAFVLLVVSLAGFFLFARGGLQQIPINIDSAYFTNNHVANDISVNSVYYFGNSFLLYNRSEIDEFLPKFDVDEANRMVAEMYNYPKDHENFILKDKRPNVIFIIMESWSAEAIGCLSETKGATPNFDKLAKEGLLFSNLYATSSTSEIGNSSIFSGNPGIPEISISLQPEKHRKLRSLNQDFQDWGYSSHYIFSGDLKYGNIGGYFMDHGFQDVKDENDFPSGLKRGKLNYSDKDLYDVLIKRINNTEGKFMHCAFTGSTHPPYDHPKSSKQNWKGVEADFMNSIIYADDCLKKFVESCKKESWFKNTLFVFIADHGHATPSAPVPYGNDFYRVPMLIWGEPLKDAYKGEICEKLGSQSDVAATLMYQFGGDLKNYPWSKDLLNPKAPEFALHTIIRGYGWVSPKGAMTYQMEQKQFIHNSFKKEDMQSEMKNCYAYLTAVYDAYKKL